MFHVTRFGSTAWGCLVEIYSAEYILRFYVAPFLVLP